MSKKHKKVSRALNYIEHLVLLNSRVTGHVSIYVFASLVGIPIEIMSSAIGLYICAITAGMKEYTSMINKK